MTPGATPDAPVLLERTDEFATITLNNPAKRNALSLSVMKLLIASLEEAALMGGVRGIVLAARGPVFSAGHDFADMAGQDLPFLRRLLRTCTDLMTLVQEVPQPTIAKVHAFATAAGCQLVASCDLAIAAESAGFALPGGRAGIFCTTPLVAVARNIGRKRALELAFTGDAVTAATAAEWGLINRAVPDADLDAATLDLITRATRGSAFAKALGKAAFYTQVDLDQPKAYSFAIEAMAMNAAADDGREGMASFMEKRPPVWTNR